MPARKAPAGDPWKKAAQPHERAAAHLAEGSFAEAEVLGLQALKLLEENAGPNHPALAHAMPGS